MAPPRRKRPSPGQYRDYKIRLPQDVAERIERKAKAEERPQNRISINEMAAIPHLESVGNLAGHVSALETLLLRHGMRITSLDVSEELLAAVDAVLAAEGGALPAAVDKLRLARAGMLAVERTKAKMKSAK